VLIMGVLRAPIFAPIFIGLGSHLLRFEWVLILFGIFLVYTGFKMMFAEDKEGDPESNAMIRQFRRLVLVTKEIDGNKFFLKVDGKLHATPLFVALLFLEMTDIVFAVD